MIVKKIIFKVEAEVLSKDSLPGLLFKVIESIESECLDGSLGMNDGDCIKWHFTEVEVTF